MVTAAWWALALWPLPAEAPAWLERTRAVCFNTNGTGLPDTSGWILLIGEPLGMLAVLMAGWGRAVRDTSRHLVSSAPGRLLATITGLLVMGGLGAAGTRVATGAVPDPLLIGSADVPDTYPRLDRPFAAADGLVDQGGRAFTLESLDGRRAFVTFAFAHCETICPLLVRSSLAARDEVASKDEMAVVVITLDPMRDTPSRLQSMVEQWQMSDSDFVVSGEVGHVDRALDALNVARVRDERTGEVVHTALVYLLESDGTVAYASTGGQGQLVELARRLR